MSGCCTRHGCLTALSQANARDSIIWYTSSLAWPKYHILIYQRFEGWASSTIANKSNPDTIFGACLVIALYSGSFYAQVLRETPIYTHFFNWGWNLVPSQIPFTKIPISEKPPETNLFPDTWCKYDLNFIALPTLQRLLWQRLIENCLGRTEEIHACLERSFPQLWLVPVGWMK